ncbi:MAG: methyltransferase domain-containing protein [Chitinophaga sp.]
MGFDISAINFLFHIRKKGINFSDTLMLGRQSYQLDGYALKKCFEQNGHTAAEAEAVLKEDPVYTEPFLRFLGAGTVDSMDASDYEHATFIHDLNKPLQPSRQYDVVIDAGTLEHVFNFPEAISTAMKLVKPGGYFISITVANNFFGHGFYQFSPELFYRVLSQENGFALEEMYFTTTRPFSPWYEVPDPKTVKSRVILENSLQSYLMMYARKTADQPLFASMPQQSDYEWISWNNTGGTENTGKGLLTRVAGILPEGLKNSIRAWRRSIKGNRLRRMLNDYGSGRPEFFKRAR